MAMNIARQAAHQQPADDWQIDDDAIAPTSMLTLLAQY
jgi:hypothetical protein